MHRQAEGGNPFNPENPVGGSVPHIISRWSLGSLQEKQQLRQRNSPETVSFKALKVSEMSAPTRKSENSSVIDTVAASPLKESLALACPHDPSINSHTFWPRKSEMESYPLWLTDFRHCGSTGEEKDYDLRKGFYARTQRHCSPSEWKTTDTHTKESTDQMNRMQLKQSRYLTSC